MELELNNISVDNLKNINLKIKENELTAIIGAFDGQNKNLIDLLIGNKSINSGSLLYLEKEITPTTPLKEYIDLQNRGYHLTNSFDDMLFNININEDLKYYLGKYDADQMMQLFNKFDLSEDILKKNYLDLNMLETKKILIIIGLLTTRKIIIFEEIDDCLDCKTINTLKKELKQLKRNNKIIIISSYNSNFLLETADRIIAVDENRIIKDGTKFDVLNDEDILKKINIEIPNIIKFIKLAKQNKNIKLKNRDNINDLIKEIYRNAN